MVCYLVENIFIEKLISYHLIGSNSALKKAREEKSKNRNIANEIFRFLCVDSTQ